MNDALTLLSAALDSSGWICIRGLAKGKPALQSFFAPGDYQGAVNDAMRLSRIGYNAFFATSTFFSKDSAKAENVNAVKCFKIDLDIGKDDPKKYPSKKDAVASIIDFCAKYGFPTPVMVDSGGGVHCYLIMTEALAPDDGKLYSEKFKALLLSAGVKIDVTVSGDVARVLRVPDTHNLKKVVARVVTLKTPVDTHDTDMLCDLIDAGYNQTGSPQIEMSSPSLLAGVALPAHLQGVVLDKTTQGMLQGKPKSFHVLLKRSTDGDRQKGCAQIAYASEHQASIEEPRWRSALSVAWHCEDGKEAIHWISRGHNEYDHDETIKKASLTTGPHTCKEFQKNWPAECDGCPHKGKITSPIQLGDYVPKAEKGANVVMAQNKSVDVAPTVYTIPEYPFPYFRAKDGGVYLKEKDDDDDATEVCKQDFYMVDRLKDEKEGYLAHMRLHHTKDGVVDFLISTESMGSPSEFAKIINKEGILIFEKGAQAVRAYVTRWFNTLAQVNEVSRVKTQFGWTKDFQSFVVGDKEILPYSTKYSPAAPSLAKLVLAAGRKGSLEEWKKVINVYGMPGFEAHAFAVMTGFGAPLMAFTNQDGVVLNAYSEESGSGKSTTLLAACSIWGEPKGLWISEQDTAQSRYHRMGVYQNLPICVDEVTNMEEEEMSEFLFTATRGKGRNRMSSSANEERDNNTSWKTIILCSANTNFTQKLQAEKTGVQGELMRLVEFDVPETDLLTKDEADGIFGKLNDHYGHAGEIYIQYVMQNMDRVRQEIAEEMRFLNQECRFQPRERYWAAAGACNIVGMMLAQEIGLHDIEVARIREFYIALVDKMRARLQYTVAKESKQNILGEYINQFSGAMIVVKVESLQDSPTPMVTVLQEPKTTKIVARYEKNLEHLYIARSEFNKFMREKRANGEAYLQLMKEKGILINADSMKRLTAGTNLPSTPVRCILFKISEDKINGIL